MNPSVKAAILSMLFLIHIRQQSNACTPGPSSKASSHHPRLTTPLKLKQRVPDISEQTLGASGAAEGRIVRGSARFESLLVENLNSDIQFKDEEATGADRFMTQRCKDKLNILAISVMNTWPGVQLRVIEAWDEDGLHEENSLHYEGRAVEITTSDRDKSKYGQLARLAVDAGFDWVSYYSRNFVHCSVRSESSVAATKGGCFHADSKVTLSSGQEKSLFDLEVGDTVMMVENDGSIGYSPVILMMDHRPKQETLFRIIKTAESSLSLTPEHLVYVSDENTTFAESRAVFGKDVRSGQYIYAHRQGDYSVIPRLVTGVSYGLYTGAIAPLTDQGSIIVDGVAASSYAVIRDEWIAHLAFTPLRWIKSLPSIRWFGTDGVDNDNNRSINQTFIHWYPKYLYKYGGYIVQSRLYDGFVLPD